MLSHLTLYFYHWPLPTTAHTSITMKLTVSSISFTTACSVFIKAPSNAVIASVVNAAYEHGVEQFEDKQTSSLGEECSFVPSSVRVDQADIGILGCAEDFVCVEDDRSSLGGRCVSVDTSHRNLDPCIKCSGTDACYGLSQDFIDNKIADGSCCGSFACYYVNEGKTFGILLPHLLSIFQYTAHIISSSKD